MALICDLGEVAGNFEFHTLALRAALRASRYDLLVSDILLPGGSGHELAALADDLAIETVLMTGHPNEIRALRIGGTRHLIKPFRLDDFMKMIDQVFAPT